MGASSRVGRSEGGAQQYHSEGVRDEEESGQGSVLMLPVQSAKIER